MEVITEGEEVICPATLFIAQCSLFVLNLKVKPRVEEIPNSNDSNYKGRWKRFSRMKLPDCKWEGCWSRIQIKLLDVLLYR
jgi:hypothetical protein